MTKKQAIKSLNKQLQKLDGNAQYSWLSQTKSYLEVIFGKESEQYKILKSFPNLDISSKDYDRSVSVLKHYENLWIEDVNWRYGWWGYNILRNKCKINMAITDPIIPPIKPFSKGFLLSSTISDISFLIKNRSVGFFL